MTTKMHMVIQHLRRALLRQDAHELTDGQLLECFVSHCETTALEALVSRHAAMVWGVCRRILPDYHDAEDAFQATFLVLVRKAPSVTPREMVGNWLYGVARQTAMKAREKTARRRARERQVDDMPEPAVFDQSPWSDLEPLLDQELSRLPDKYRTAIVLCDLEGNSRKKAAQQLGCPEGTLAARLARGRVMLARRLAARGLAVSGGALAGLLSHQAASACVPASLVSCTMKAVTLVATGQATTGIISAKAAALAEGVLKVMLLNKVKITSAVLLLIAVFVGGAVGLSGGTMAAAAGDEPAVTGSGDFVQVNNARSEHPAPSKEGPSGPKSGAADQPQAKGASDKKTSLEDWESAESEGDVAFDLAKDPGSTLDGLWEDIENKGAWFLFHESTIRWHPAPSQLSDADKQRDRVKALTKKWTCRYNLTLTPMTINVFHKDGTRRGIFVVERATLFIALAKIGKDRPTSFERDDATTLWVLKRVKPSQQKGMNEDAMAAFYERTGHPGAAAFYRDIAARKKKEKEKDNKETKEKPVLEVRAVLRSVDVKKLAVTAEVLNERSAASLLRLLSRAMSDKETYADAVARALEELAMRSASDRRPKLVNVPVRPDATITSGGKAMKLVELRAGRVVSLQLAGDPTSGLVVAGIQVMDPKDAKKP
jgi:RNA polymerase sigma factor (sigma-70 family)